MTQEEQTCHCYIVDIVLKDICLPICLELFEIPIVIFALIF
jgi:hypothetical protein